MKQSLRRVLKVLSRVPTPVILVSCLLVGIVVLWWQGAIEEFWDIVTRADVPLIIAGFALFVVGLFLLCLRWHALVRMANDGNSHLGNASEAFLASVIINYAAPIGLAVPSRAALTKRALGLSAHATGTIALWEIAADLVVLGVGSLLWILLHRSAFDDVVDELGDNAFQFGMLGLVLVVGLIAAVGFLGRKPAIRQKVRDLLGRIARAPLQSPRVAAEVLAISVVYWVLQAVTLAVFLEALAVETSITLLHGLTTLPFLIGILSPIPGGAVIRESLMYVVASLTDTDGGDVVAAAVIYRMALFLAIPVLFAIVRGWTMVSRSNAPDGAHQ